MSPRFEIEYTVQDARRNDPVYRVPVHASRSEIGQLVNEGYVLRGDLFADETLEALRCAVDRVESDEPGLTDGCFGGTYLRYLEEKDPVFLRLITDERLASIAKAVLGPQVQADEIVARVVPGGSSPPVPWHIHYRVVPRPLPPFFSYPHAINVLVYLDPIAHKDGPLVLMPKSHFWREYGIAYDDVTGRPGQRVITCDAGTCVIMHGNLWHRTLAPESNARRRRVLILGYVPSWVRTEERGGNFPPSRLTDELRKVSSDELRALLGEFYWG